MQPNNTKRYMIVMVICWSLLFIDLGQAKCQNMLEKSGACTKCDSSKFLYKGDCFNKIRGCQDYVSDKICLSCQSGYAFNEGSCIKQAIFYRLQKADIPPVKINIEGELSYRDIEERIGQSRKGMFEMINRYFQDKYPKNISSCTINNVKYIETINGVIFTIYYRSMMKIYEAIAFIDSKRDSQKKKTITELQFSQKNAIPAYSLEQINSGIKKKYQKVLKDCLLSSIQKGINNRYKMSFVNSKGQKYECLVEKEPFFEVQEMVKVQNPIDMEDILAYVFNIYPDLKSLDFEVVSAPFFDSNSNQGLYVLIFGQKIQIKITNKKGVFDLLSYKNIEMENRQKEGKEEVQQSPPKLVGGYQIFQDLTDPAFLQVWRYFIAQYPKYKSYEIVEVKYQIVAGTNFIISIKSPKQVAPAENVKALIFYPLNSPIQVVELEVDGQKINMSVDSYKDETGKDTPLEKPPNSQISVENGYDYKNDPQFTEAYRFMLESLKIVNFVPIIQVKRFDFENHIDFEVIYSVNQKAKVRRIKQKQSNLRKDSHKFEVLHYLVDGNDLAHGNKVSQQDKKSIIRLIQKQKSQIFNNIQLQSFKEKEQSYEVNLLTNTGSYSAEVKKHQKGPILSSLIQISPSNCYEFSDEIYDSDDEIQKADQFLRNNYGLNGSVLQLFQTQVTEGSKKYRVMYTDQQKRKFQILLENFSGKLIVIRSLILQQGYVPVELGDRRIIPVQAISKVHFGEFIKKCEIKLRLSNQTHFKLIYACPNKAFEYVYFPGQKTDKLQIIYQENEQLNHTEIHKSNKMDLKQAIYDQKFIDIDTMIRSKFVEYVQTSQVTDAEREEKQGDDGRKYLTYKIYYRSSLGYYICEAIWTDGEIKLTNFYLSTTKTNKNCQILDQKTSECIQCLPNYQLQFGSCFEQIPFCQSQVGRVCVICDQKTVLKDGKCLRNCDQVFALRQQKVAA